MWYVVVSGAQKDSPTTTHNYPQLPTSTYHYLSLPTNTHIYPQRAKFIVPLFHFPSSRNKNIKAISNSFCWMSRQSRSSRSSCPIISKSHCFTIHCYPLLPTATPHPSPSTATPRPPPPSTALHHHPPLSTTTHCPPPLSTTLHRHPKSLQVSFLIPMPQSSSVSCGVFCSSCCSTE